MPTFKDCPTVVRLSQVPLLTVSASGGRSRPIAVTRSDSPRYSNTRFGGADSRFGEHRFRLTPFR